jgi:hypothetical protein
MTIRRLRKANEIAAKRLREFERDEERDDLELGIIARYNTRERPHKEPKSFDAGHLRDWHGSCDCEGCTRWKAEHSYKGKGAKKRKWRELKAIELK